jgi:hypothetical protein
MNRGKLILNHLQFQIYQTKTNLRGSKLTSFTCREKYHGPLSEVFASEKLSLELLSYK